jgi:hypothetical protein
MKNSELLKKWKKVELIKPPFIFQNDKEIIKKLEKKGKTNSYSNIKDYINSNEFYNKIDSTIHLGLRPLPFAGNLRKASIYLLSGNPGLSPVDYYIEESDQKYVRDLVNNLKQSKDNNKYPLFLLNPKYSWYAGFEYWERILRDILELIMIKRKLDFKGALQLISKRVAVINLLPYHIKRFAISEKELSKFDSVKLMKEFVHKELVKVANNGEALLIVLQKSKFWGLKENKNIIVYDKNEARGDYLSRNSRGGSAILKKLNIKIEE